MTQFTVQGFNAAGAILATFDGVDIVIPDDLGNMHRSMIYDQWEFEPAIYNEDGNQIGDRVRKNTIPPYEAPEPVELTPDMISDRQFFQQLAAEELITEAEAEEAVGSGAIPIAMLALVDDLPVEYRHDARMKIRGATTFERLNPTTMLIQALYNWDDNKRDEFWLAASKLI